MWNLLTEGFDVQWFSYVDLFSLNSEQLKLQVGWLLDCEDLWGAQGILVVSLDPAKGNLGTPSPNSALIGTIGLSRNVQEDGQNHGFLIICPP
jgi:hypothetical protein